MFKLKMRKINLYGYGMVRIAEVKVIIFCVVFYRSLFVLFILAIELSILRFKTPDYTLSYLQTFLIYICVLSISFIYVLNNLAIRTSPWRPYWTCSQHQSMKFIQDLPSILPRKQQFVSLIGLL